MRAVIFIAIASLLSVGIYEAATVVATAIQVPPTDTPTVFPTPTLIIPTPTLAVPR